VLLTATLPKFISTVLVIAIGVTIVAVAVAVACAKVADVKAARITANEISFFKCFIS
jgi:CRISPR/Cas system-associated endonuclease/helicase Cas3